MFSLSFNVGFYFHLILSPPPYLIILVHELPVLMGLNHAFNTLIIQVAHQVTSHLVQTKQSSSTYLDELVTLKPKHTKCLNERGTLMGPIWGQWEAKRDKKQKKKNYTVGLKEPSD